MTDSVPADSIHTDNTQEWLIDRSTADRQRTDTYTHTKRDARSTVVRQLNRCAPCAVCVNHHVISGLFLAGQACWVLILIDVVDGQH